MQVFLGRLQAESNVNLSGHESSDAISKAKVVATTTALIWDHLGQPHSNLRKHFENVALLLTEEGQ